ncbi:hypothetical protein K3495_g4263 [Podosphaera aphanis]|nr:hypothetical protein K3495_g4263 [Podosphaera aphanis]
MSLHYASRVGEIRLNYNNLEKKLKAARSDNAPELKKTTDKDSSNQNGVTERSIQTAENSMRAMLEDAKLPIEFWDEAMEADAYIRNRTPIGLIEDEKIKCPGWTFSGEIPSIDHIRVWGSKAYTYVDPKTLPKDSRHDKFMLRGRDGVFMGYTDPKDKQLKFYAPDLGYTQRVSVLFVDERLKEELLISDFEITRVETRGSQIKFPTENAETKKSTSNIAAKDDSNRLIIAVDSNHSPASDNTNEIVVVDPDKDPTLNMMTINQLKPQKGNTMAIQNYKDKLRPRWQKEFSNTKETAEDFQNENDDQNIVVQPVTDGFG